jgi:hypothetical protein
LLFGGTGIAAAIGDGIDVRVFLWVQLAVGVGLFAWSFRFDPKRRTGPGPAARWRDRVTAGTSSAGWLVGLAAVAALAELATMLPYLGAITMMATAELPAAGSVAMLSAYCLVMVLPAAGLLAARAMFPARIEPVLERMSKWMIDKGTSATGWLLGIAGFLIARDAIAHLWFPWLLGK